MESVVWASMFLLLTVVGAPVGFAGLIGMPISADVLYSLIGMAGLVAVSGIGLLLMARASAVEAASPPVTAA